MKTINNIIRIVKLYPKHSLFIISVIVILIITIYPRNNLEAIRNNLNKIRGNIINEASAGVGESTKKIEQIRYELWIEEGYKARLEECIEYNTKNLDSFVEPKECNDFGDYIKKMEEAMNLEINSKHQATKTPDELFYTLKASDNCRVSQTEDQHYKQINGGILATDVACGYQAEVFAPDYIDEVRNYKVTVAEDTLLGNYVELAWCEPEGIDCYKWVIGHLDTRLKTGDIVQTGTRIGQTDLSGITTGHHSHIELWAMLGKEWKNISYTTRSTVLNNKRKGEFDTPEGNTIYFTSYDLGDEAQNDGAPCIGASGRDLCEIAKGGIQTVALTVDMRKKLNIEFGDSINLRKEGDVNGGVIRVRVEDEMNKRFRYSCIKKNGFCIKGDIAKYNGNALIESGVYTIIK